MFCHFWQQCKLSKWRPFLKNVPKLGIVFCLDTLGVANFKSENSIWLPFFQKQGRYREFSVFNETSKLLPFSKNKTCLQIGQSIFVRCPGNRKLTKSLHFALLSKYRHCCVFAKNFKIQNGCRFLKHKNF